MIALVSYNVENERKIALGMSQHAVPMGTSGTGIEPLKHEKCCLDDSQWTSNITISII